MAKSSNKTRKKAALSTAAAKATAAVVSLFVAASSTSFRSPLLMTPPVAEAFTTLKFPMSTVTGGGIHRSPHYPHSYGGPSISSTSVERTTFDGGGAPGGGAKGKQKVATAASGVVGNYITMPYPGTGSPPTPAYMNINQTTASPQQQHANANGAAMARNGAVAAPAAARTAVLAPPATTPAAATLVDADNANRDVMSKVPSLTDLYSATVTIRRAMEEKEKVYSEIIDKLEEEQHSSIRAIEAWQNHYNNTIANLQEKAAKAQREGIEKDVAHRRQIRKIEEENEIRQSTSLDKINWLTEQLHQLKLKTHRQQIEANEAAQAQQNALLSRIDELQTKLKRQMELTEAEGSKADGYLKERMALQEELTRVSNDFQEMIAELNRQLSDERQGRMEDRRRAIQQLEEAREEAQRQIGAVQEEAQQQKAKMADELKQKEGEFQRSVESIKETARQREMELDGNIDRLSSELEQVRADSERKLQEEKTAALDVQNQLQQRIAEKEKELENQISLKNMQVSKAEGLFEQRMELERDLSLLKKEYADAVSQWESRYKVLQQQHAKEMREVENKLAREREAAQREIDAALQEAENQKVALEQGLKAKDSQHSAVVRQLEEESAKKEKDLQDTLQATNEELQELQLVSHEQLTTQKEAAEEMREELMTEISDKERELQNQVKLTEEQAKHAEELWQRRMQLEEELSSLKHEHVSTVTSWQDRYRKLETTRLKEARAAETLLARKEAEAREELDKARQKIKEHKAALETGLMGKDKHYQLKIKELQLNAERKEQQLKENLERISSDLQKLRFESHRKLENEKERAARHAAELQAEIDKKERQLAEQTAITAKQSSKVEELWKKRMQLEQELSAANDKFDTALSQWEGVFKSLEEARVKEQKDAKDLLARKEAEASAKIDAAVEEAKTHKEALETGLKLKDAEYNAAVNKLRNESQKKEQSLRDNLDRVSTEYQQFKIDSHKSLMAEKTAFKKKETSLMSQIQGINEELAQQSTLAAENGARADELWKKRAALEALLNDTKMQHAGAIAEWRTKYTALEDARVREQKAAAEALARTEAEGRKQLEVAVAKGEAHKAKLNNCLDAIARQEVELQAEMERMSSMLGNMQSAMSKIREMSFSDCPDCRNGDCADGSCSP